MFGVSLKRGATRLIFLTKRYVLKMPRASALSDGLWANRTETHTWKTDSDESLCPIVWGDGCGFLVLMRRARCLTDEEFDEFLMQDALIASNPFASNITMEVISNRATSGCSMVELLRSTMVVRGSLGGLEHGRSREG